MTLQLQRSQYLSENITIKARVWTLLIRCLTFEDWRNLEHPETANRKHLPESQLHKKHGNAREDKCNEIWYKKSAAAIFVTPIEGLIRHLNLVAN